MLGVFIPTKRLIFIRDDSLIHFDAWEEVHIACHQPVGGKPQAAISKADPR